MLNTQYITNIRKRIFSLKVAFRYIFSKKSHNAINVISGISAIGVAIGTMALVVVLSVFNGFEQLIANMFSAFDPDFRITAVEGKSFEIDKDPWQTIRKMPDVAVFTEVVEENALLRFRDRQMAATVKGVGENYRQLTDIDSIMYDGKFELFDGAFERAVVGIGLAGSLSLGAHFIDPLYIYAPKRTSRINMLRPESSFNQAATFTSGIFAVQQVQYDNQYVLVSLDLARELFEYEAHVVSCIELKINDKADAAKLQKQLQAIVGSDFVVKNRYEQQESFFKIMQVEKWITFLILSFILLIASFNIIGSLSMLIIDKQADIKTLRSLGASTSQIKSIFLLEGWMISALGALFGILLGTVISLVQQHFGVLRMGSGYVVDAYPVVLVPSDILYVFITVVVMGFLAAYYPVRYINPEKLK